MIFEPQHEISNNVVHVCVTSKGSDQPAHTRSLIRAYASRLNILWLLSYIVGNHMSRLNYPACKELNLYLDLCTFTIFIFLRLVKCVVHFTVIQIILIFYLVPAQMDISWKIEYRIPSPPDKGAQQKIQASYMSCKFV